MNFRKSLANKKSEQVRNCPEDAYATSPGRVGAASKVLQDGDRANTLMASSMKQSGSHDVKNKFTTKEGCYTLLNLSEYCRPNRLPYTVQHPFPVRISFVTLKEPGGSSDRIAFNVGKELFVYVYKGVKKVGLSPKKDVCFH